MKAMYQLAALAMMSSMVDNYEPKRRHWQYVEYIKPVVKRPKAKAAGKARRVERKNRK
jgi:hypothetical protein